MAASAPHDAAVRATLGSYRLFGEVGRDPLGVLFLACPAGAATFPKWAVVRRMHSGVARDPTMVHSFLAATQASVRMVHRNIATTFDFGGKMTLPWAAREHLLGVTVVDLVARLVAQRTKLAWALASYLVAEAAEGVSAVQARLPSHGPPMGFLAGAVAPSVFVTRRGEVKIVDGCLPLIGGLPLIDSEAMPYRPREPVATGAGRGRSDAFGLGVVLWELVAGRRLFAGRDDDETSRLLDAKVIPSLRTLAKAPSVVDDIVQRALGKSAGNSAPLESAAEVANALRAGLVGQGKRAGAEDVARMMEETFAAVLDDQRAAIERAWDQERDLQAQGHVPVEAASESDVTRSNGETVRDPTTETEITGRGGRDGFDEAPTIPRGQRNPLASDSSWRTRTPAYLAEKTEPSFSSAPPRPRSIEPQLHIPNPRIDYFPESPAPPPFAPQRPPGAEAAVIVSPTPRAFTLPPIERAGLAPLEMPPPRMPPPVPEAGLLPSSSRREQTKLVRQDPRSSPLLVGGVAFALSFLAIAIFGVSRRASSDSEPVGVSLSPPPPSATGRAETAPTTPSSRRPSDPWTTVAPNRGGFQPAVPVAAPDDLPHAPPTPQRGGGHGASVPPPTPSGHVGLLTVFCTPACDQVFDGARPLGPSPVFKVPASVGVHRLRLRVDAVEKRVTVTVTENDTTVVRENVGD